jgi:hypothetical protein
MSYINPIRKDPVSHTQGSAKPKRDSQDTSTAAKVNGIVKLGVVKQTGLQGRFVTKLSEANQLAKRIRHDWNFLPPEELAERIIDLENRVAEFKESSPAVDKIKKQAEHLHFQFVFPVVLELQEPGKSMPPTFARTIHQAANQVFKSHSLQPFQQLNSTQQREILAIATRRES